MRQDRPQPFFKDLPSPRSGRSRFYGTGTELRRKSRGSRAPRQRFTSYPGAVMLVLLVLFSGAVTSSHASTRPALSPEAALSADKELEESRKKNNGGLLSGELIGIIFASVFGSVLLLFFTIWGWHKVKQRHGEKVEREYAEEMRAAVETARRSRLVTSEESGAFAELGRLDGKGGCMDDVLGDKNNAVGGADRYGLAAGGRKSFEEG
ncbi:hypothetical protein EX30DRAFT_398996 [Ascodesmis nigricans]|uniref:Transmembrane protein n=1 Tax=Ascodesmis nigricans TaxID=341454 RepID=A0A4S2MIV5_9PEZI|nr:hypothetical protein EX30DRAFT_398996 [Ascodesmis nigricans]